MPKLNSTRPAFRPPPRLTPFFARLPLAMAVILSCLSGSIALALPNVTPYKPSGWSDKLILATSTCKTQDSSSFTTSDTIYMSYALINDGGSAASSGFKNRILVDGQEIGFVDTVPVSIPAGVPYTLTCSTFKVTGLTAGSHKFRLELDYLNQLSESNDNDNVYEKTITVGGSSGGQPDLVVVNPYMVNDANQAVSLVEVGQTVRFRFSVKNQGAGATSVTQMGVRADKNGQLFDSGVLDVPIVNSGATLGPFTTDPWTVTAGPTTFRFTADSTNLHTESNESNNSLDYSVPYATSSPPAITYFTASPATINAGAASRLSWATQFATSVSIDPGIGTVETSGYVDVKPTATTTYKLTAKGSGPDATSTQRVSVHLDVLIDATILSGPVPLTTTLAAFASGGTPPYTYIWSTGDTTTNTMLRKTWTTAIPPFEVWCTVKDATNATAESNHITITPLAAQVCSLTCQEPAVPATGVVGQPVTFKQGIVPGTGCPADAAVYQWSFSDGGQASGSQATHIFSAAKTYDWSVIATLGGSSCGRAGSITITAGTLPIKIDPATVNLANVSESADRFHLWVDLENTAPAGPADPSLYDFRIVPATDTTGNTVLASGVSEGRLPEANSRVRIGFTLEKNRNYAVESGLLQIRRKSDGALFTVPESQLTIDVIGTEFNMGKHAFPFANGATVIRLDQNDFANAMNTLERYLGNTSALWSAIGWRSNDRSQPPAGVCAGMALSSAANFNHRGDLSYWGDPCDYGAALQGCYFKSPQENSWNDAIVSRSGQLAAGKPNANRPFANPDILSSTAGLVEPGSGALQWSIEAAKKITYYHFVDPENFELGNAAAAFKPAGRHSFSASQVVRTLRAGKVMPLILQQGNIWAEGHDVVLVQFIQWVASGKANWKLVIYNGNQPLNNDFVHAPFAEIWWDPYHESSSKRLCSTFRLTGSGEWDKCWECKIKGLIYPDLGGDSQYIYSLANKDNRSVNSAEVKSHAGEPGPLGSDATYNGVIEPGYIEVLLVGASSFRVSDLAGSLAVDPVLYGQPDGSTVIYRKDANSFLTTLLLPSKTGKVWRVSAAKDQLMSRLRVFINTPRDNGTVDAIAYPELQGSYTDATSVEFFAGKDNQDFEIRRTSGSSTTRVAPTYVRTFSVAVDAVSGLMATVTNGEVTLSWKNPSHPRFAKVRVLRKYGSSSQNESDGTVLAEGKTGSVKDKPASQTAFYSVFVFDDIGAKESRFLSVDITRFCISGRVVDSVTGLPVSGAEILVSDAAGLLMNSTSSADGTYSVCNLLPGNYTAMSRIDGSISSANTKPFVITTSSAKLDFDAARSQLMANFSMAPGEPHVDAPVTFSGISNGGVTDWRWDFGDGATGSGQTASHTFSKQGSFIVTLRISNSHGTASVSRSVTVGPPIQQLYLSNAHVRVDVTWRSQYTGQTGTAYALPQSDNFGYFYFSDKSNPEVFVKVLDFGSTSPYLLFYAGLTDFEYKVTYTSIASGKSVSFTKSAGSLNGWGDNTSLPHRAYAALWDGDSEEASEVPDGYLASMRPQEPPLTLRAAGAAPAATELLLANGTVAATVSYRNQYSGQTGTAQALPQGDQFGFFYFSDAGNPEVFVKVLDWGADKPYLIFYAGLTDFEYTVSFRQVQTGQVVPFKKTAGTYNGGADNTSLKHGSTCTYSLTTSSISILAAGGSSSFTIQVTPRTCPWTAGSNSPWITITSGTSGTGSGEVAYSVTANSGAARTGTITAGGQTFTVNQAAGNASLQEATINLPGNIPMVLVKIPKGTFQMGSPTSEQNRSSNETLHQVTLTQDYYMGKTEVTQAQWKAIMGMDAPTSCGNRGIGGSNPVYCISWNSIRTAGGFLERLNQHLTSTGQTLAGKLRLPTEAEWERAARGGTQTRFSFGDNTSCSDQCDWCDLANLHMWWCGNTIMTQPIGQKSVNPYGLADIHGNVFEFVEDTKADYPSGAVTDPVVTTTGEKICRGGAFSSGASSARSAARFSIATNGFSENIGFRVAATP